MNGRAFLCVIALIVVMLAIWPVSSPATTGVQTITIKMGEQGGRMYFRPDRVTLQAGLHAEVVLVNAGKLPHEWMVYDMPTTAGKPEHEWVEQHSYFKGIKTGIKGAARVERSRAGDLMELELKPGRQATVEFTPTRNGTYQMGCLLPEHWERGMKGTLVVK